MTVAKGRSAHTLARDDFDREAARVATLYEHFDAYRTGIEERLAEVRLAPRGGTPQSRTERDVLARQLERRLDALAIGDLPLCFGRLDLDDGSRLYIGRVGLAGDGEDPLLVDWRAPVASLFYSATPGSPGGVIRRRHLIIAGRTLVSIEDEVFDLDAFDRDDAGELYGDGALLAALSRGRTGHMHDIVATIQQQQDEVIRAELAGALVVQGGPGTGKTAVALHRAAYLLYAHRARLVSSGVMVMGPSAVFLRYIEQVLPSLGETGVVMATARSFFPGVRAAGHDSDATAAQKGREEMSRVIAKAIADRQRAPREELEIVYERSRIVISSELLERARQRGRRSHQPHNQARRAVEASVLDAATSIVRRDRIAHRLPEPSHEELAGIRRGVRRTREFRAALERMWPILSPHELLNDLFGIRALARSAVRGIDDLDPSLLVRPRVPHPESAPWTVEDVPLLDEAGDQLGSWTDAADRRARRARAADRRREVGYARSVLGSLDLAIDINAEHFADRFTDQLDGNDVAHASRERTWKFGHVIVDEAQELSPMAWRMVYRRAPSRSMTIVGDLAQGGAPWAPSLWSEVLEPFARDRWRLVELSTNYRTPTEIMDVANAVLAIAAPGARPTTAIRSSGRPPLRRRVPHGALASSVADAAKRILEDVVEGRMAVIAPSSVIPLLQGKLVDQLGSDFDPSNPLGARAALLGIREAKGLEFDTVLLVEPGEIARHHPRGLNDLYVALTRATQRLLVIHEEALTPELDALITPLSP